MTHLPVSSSNVESVAHDVPTNKLQVQMRHGKLYEFHDVPKETYDEMMAAPSIGKYIHGNLKRNYRNNEVRP